MPLDSTDDDTESLLTEVDCEEDKYLIMDILCAIKMCRSPDTLCTSWTLIPCSTGYTLVAYLPRAQQQIEVTHDDINMICLLYTSDAADE